MNLERAMKVLDLSDSELETPDILKRKYRAKILQYHPDKNRDPDAADRFREVQEAYSLLLRETDDDANKDDLNTKSYDDLMSEFLSAFFDKDCAYGAAPFISKICKILFRRINTEYLCRLNRPLLTILHRIMTNYRSAFHLPDGLFESMEEVLMKTVEEYVVLNPTLEDLLSEENIYKLKYEDKTFLVPLWHHDMTFNLGSRELMVKCFPVLPDNMELDECNVLTVQLEYSVEEVWNREVEVMIGGRTFKFDGRQLRMIAESQQIVLKGCGVPYNNTSDILDCGTRQNIVLEIGVWL